MRFGAQYNHSWICVQEFRIAFYMDVRTSVIK